MKLFLFILFISVLLNAQNSDNCDDCTPLAEVSLTNAGLEKIISLSIDENLNALDAEVSERSKTGFRQLKLDRSHCKTQTISTAWKNRKSEDNCYGLPDLDDSGLIGSDTQLRPYTAELKNFKLNKIDLELAAPVKCKNFVCDFEIKSKNIEITGDLSVNYTDKNEAFIPPTTITLKTTPDADIRMTGQALIQPKTGKINDLIFLKEEKTKLKIAPSSLVLDMPFKTEFANHEEEIRIKAKNFHRYVPVGKIDTQYINTQYKKMRAQLINDIGAEIAEKRKTEGKPPLHLQDERALAEAQVDQMIKNKYGSVSQFKQRLHAIKWPSPDDAKGTYEFIQNPPRELVVFEEISDKMDFANVAAIGENSGFTNAYAFAFTTAAVELGNIAGNSNYVTSEFVQPILEKEILPVVHFQVNEVLGNLKQYWNQISKIPNLNAQNLQILADLESKLKYSKSPEEKSLLEQKIKDLKTKMQSDWVSIDTEVAIDKNSRNGKLLKAQILKSNPACSTLPKRFSDDNDDDFDMRTQFGVNTLQEYFDRMAKNKNLDLCTDSQEPATCKGGTKINLKNPPKIACDNGDFTFEFDAEAATKILGFNASADLNAKVKAKVNNCAGSPCIQFTDSNGRFKNVFLNTFFGHMLDRGLTTALINSNNTPIKVPNAKMKKTQSSKKDCTTKLDWTIERTNQLP